ncbi:ABC transporter permease [Oceanirhabdus sp. W0125-5]|uniref:ABC transporter permease n=1 Tax=Oceanirhabdus sp. W0125-5 TaxID=2999116 RepID=UPI0022F30CFE|nr:ABC transporter permease [Oceanirhabdus sp. W0125-5]WBW96552.1 ABC transporter permease [Oceanirhabdus sp. W0125-5]
MKNQPATTHKEFLDREKKEGRKITLWRIGILIVIFILWEIFSQLKIIDPFLTSSPSRMFKTLLTLYKDGNLIHHILITTGETILGFILGTLLGTIIASILWWFKRVNKILEPYIIVLNALPKVALAPIIIFWVGNGIKAILVVALLISIIITIITMLNGFNTVDEDKIKLMKTFGATKFQILINLIIPANISTLLTALQLNVGLSWVGVIIGEFLVAKSGLGFLIVYGGQISQLDMVMLSIIILALIAFIMYKIIDYIKKNILSKKFKIHENN